jgi:hypothetical protein
MYFLSELFRRYQAALAIKYKTITNFCGLFGVFLGLGAWYLLVLSPLENHETEFNELVKASVLYGYAFGAYAIILFVVLIFVGAYICHIPFVLAGTITSKEALRAVFLFKHPERWLK